MEFFGKMIAPDTLRFERRLRGPVERVWAYLTESEKRGKWLAKGEMELFAGGKVSLYFLHSELSPEAGAIPERFKGMEAGHHFTGTVLRVEAPRLLSFTWEGNSEVTFELLPQDGEVLLLVTHRKLPTELSSRVSVLGGWHTHLAILRALFDGEVPPNFWKKYTSMEGMYQQRLNPQGETGMLIRKPVAEVFEAFVNPASTTQFWFSRGTGRLEKGGEAEWFWDMYNFSSKVQVQELVLYKTIGIEWGAAGAERTRAEWSFREVEEGFTFVRIVVDGFSGDEDSVHQKVTDQVAGFCWVLAGAKAWLEYGIRLNLVGDRFYGGRH